MINDYIKVIESQIIKRESKKEQQRIKTSKKLDIDFKELLDAETAKLNIDKQP